MILVGDEKLIKSCKEDLAREFEMNYKGILKYFLGLEIWKRDGEIFVSQDKYTNNILKKFHMEEGGCYFRKISRCYCLQETCGFTHVLGEHMTKHMICG